MLRDGRKPSSVFDDYLSMRLHRSFPPRKRWAIVTGYPGVSSYRISRSSKLAPRRVFHASSVTRRAVSSYLAVSPLPAKAGGILSVALSLGSPRVAVSNCASLRCSDFPPAIGGQSSVHLKAVILYHTKLILSRRSPLT